MIDNRYAFIASEGKIMPVKMNWQFTSDRWNGGDKFIRVVNGGRQKRIVQITTSNKLVTVAVKSLRFFYNTAIAFWYMSTH